MTLDNNKARTRYRLLITGRLLLAFSVFRAQPVSFSEYFDLSLGSTWNGALDRAFRTKKEATSSRKAWLRTVLTTLAKSSPRASGNAILRTRRDVETNCASATKNLETNSQRRPGEMPNAEIICHSVYSRRETRRQQIQFQFIQRTKILIDILE